MRERAKSQEQTRLRIVEATMQLHEELGPRNTTITEIAKRAGVQRLTVYSHFPDETAVFQACTAHWLSLNPPPDPASWSHIEDPDMRFRAAILAFYGYFSATKRMWVASFRDVAEVPALQQPMADVAAFLGGVAQDLAAAFPDRTDELTATIRHALHFPTWLDLDDQGFTDAGKLKIASLWVAGATRTRSSAAEPSG
jgi:AcrR family transcriptional regulator